MAGKRSPARATGSPGAWCTYSAAPWSISHRPWCQRSRLGLRGVRSTLSTKASNQTTSAASSGSGGSCGVNGNAPGRKSIPRLIPPLAAISSWISGSGSAAPSAGSSSISTSSGTGRPRARPTSPATISAASALVPWPAPRNLSTYSPSSSASTSPGIEPPSRSGVTYRVAVTVRSTLASWRAMPTKLWEPPEELVENALMTKLHALARPWLRDLRRPVAVLRRGPRGVLGLDLEVLRGRLVLRRGARQARDARRRVVQGRRGQLRRARLPGQGGRRAGDRPRGRAARPGRAHVGRAARAGRGDRGRVEGHGRRARGPRGGVHAEHPGGDRGVPRDRFDRRRVVELLAGLRRAQRRRPLPADRAEGAAGGRRLQVQRQGVRPHGDGRRDPLRGRRRAGAARLPGRLRLAGRLPRRRRAGVRARAVRPPAVGALLVRHHGAAEGDRPGPGRDPHRAPQEAPPPRGPAGRRPLLLVHHHRLDDVELPGQRPAHRRRDRALRRLSRIPGHGRAVGLRRVGGGDDVRHQRELHRRLHEGRASSPATAATCRS